MEIREKIKETMAGLKDFQTKTVEYAIDQLYVKNRSKILIADEVGLGKTIVAKGIIAKAFEEYLNQGNPSKQNPTFNVIYICSNLALAKQNIRKLNFLGKSEYVDETINRLIYLAYKPKDKLPAFLIQALTPGTSFEEKSHMGASDERAIIFSLLAHYTPFFNRWEGLKWLLKGGIQNMQSWEGKLQYLYDNRLDIIRRDLFGMYRKELNEFIVDSDSMPKLHAYIRYRSDTSLWHAIMKVSSRINGDNYNDFSIQSEIIKILRRILSRICLQYLGADIFILDEFQRYNNLINLHEEAESPAIETARTVFSIREAKTLMLSATPFKPYTNDFDELNGEVHYKEFKNVLRFLLDDTDDSFWAEFEKDRHTMFAYLRHPDKLKDNFEPALKLKNKLEKLYRDGMVRTEKLLASNDRDALIKLVNKPITVQTEDISDFIVLDQITQYINKNYKASLPVPLEYVKSSPFALSYLDKYQHKEKIRKYIREDDTLKKLIKQTRHGWLNLNTINNYKPLIPVRSQNMPNAKLRLLFEETIWNNGWRYLWIPPSIPYYDFEGAFKDSWGFSKTLIFSSWKLVPKMVSTLVSYEAERQCIGNLRSLSEREKREREKSEGENIRYNYFQKRRSPRPQFTFKVLDEQEPQEMNNFILTYPSVFLAKVYDPIQNLSDKKTVSQLKRDLKNQFIDLFNELDLNQYVSGEGDWQKWFWLAPLFLDKATNPSNKIVDWFTKDSDHKTVSIDADDLKSDREESAGKQIHFKTAANTFIDNGLFPAAKLNSRQISQISEYMALLTLGSPAICFLRTMLRTQELSIDLLDAAYDLAMGFITMINKPESIAIIRLHHRDGDYREKVLEYMIDGNIQSMLDEFIYLLSSSENIQSATELSDFITDILSVRTVSSDVDDYASFIKNPKAGRRSRKSMRSHYAVDFGSQKVNVASGSADRSINIRQAFNSPFRPFVLASTSIGQEGLDFHLYCKKIFHWNLPSNPIDFEQREGRIHRYQGLVIRLNLADKYKNKIEIKENTKNVWKEIITLASEEKVTAKFPCDIVPFWHSEAINDIKIERFVPLYPFSRDIEKYINTIKILTYYRLTFGQPRQQELVEALQGNGFSDEDLKYLDDLIIDLSPIKFMS